LQTKKLEQHNFQKINPLVFKPAARGLQFIGGWTMPRNRSYQEDLLQVLQDSEEAAAYLSAALEDGNDKVFLLALRTVVEASIGMTELAHKTDRNRESLYKTLSNQGNPHLSSILSILSGLGYRLTVEAAPVSDDSLVSV
jgi:probable addiction module antidote protein